VTSTTNRARIGSRTQREFAALYAWVDSLEPEWWTVAITFQRGPEWIRLRDTRWRVQLSFFGTRWGWTRNSHIRYSVTISLSSDATPRQRAALRRAGTLGRVAETLGALGYEGKWHPRHGAHFMKDLRSQAAVREEVERLRGTSFKALLGEPGRRTTR
jgi:hypothetical protein